MTKSQSITTCQLPDSALLQRYVESGDYTDCFTLELSKLVSHEEFVTAFYTSSVFKLERFLLSWIVSKPSSDAEAKLLAAKDLDTFSAWTVEARCHNQLLMCDYQKRTRSWLMTEKVVPEAHNNSDHYPGPVKTRLYFGSAVTRIKNRKTGEMSLGLGFYLLKGFHKIYSRILLYAAKTRLNTLSA
jgi:hypothetical protein